VGGGCRQYSCLCDIFGYIYILNTYTSIQNWKYGSLLPRPGSREPVFSLYIYMFMSLRHYFFTLHSPPTKGGGSAWPAYSTASLVDCCCCRAKPIQGGTVVVYRSVDRCILLRASLFFWRGCGWMHVARQKTVLVRRLDYLRRIQKTWCAVRYIIWLWFGCDCDCDCDCDCISCGVVVVVLYYHYCYYYCSCYYHYHYCIS
jgi:hypothetical protein